MIELFFRWGGGGIFVKFYKGVFISIHPENPSFAKIRQTMQAHHTNTYVILTTLLATTTKIAIDSNTLEQ